jgi:hypothetical protein
MSHISALSGGKKNAKAKRKQANVHEKNGEYLHNAKWHCSRHAKKDELLRVYFCSKCGGKGTAVFDLHSIDFHFCCRYVSVWEKVGKLQSL